MQNYRKLICASCPLYLAGNCIKWHLIAACMDKLLLNIITHKVYPKSVNDGQQTEIHCYSLTLHIMAVVFNIKTLISFLLGFDLLLMKWMQNLITLIERVVRLSLFSFLIASLLLHYPWQATFWAQHPTLQACFSHMQRHRTGCCPSFPAGSQDARWSSLGTPHKCLCFLLQGHRNAKVGNC